MMTGVRKRLGSLLGPNGIKGDDVKNPRLVGDDLVIDEVSRTASGTVTTPKTVGNVRGPQGIPGPNAIPTDEAIAIYVSTGGSSSRIAVDDVIDGAIASRLPAATDAARGTVELATAAEAAAGADAVRAVTPAGLKPLLDGKAASTHSHSAGDVASGTFAAARLPAATVTAAGAIELATAAEVDAGTDAGRAVTPAALAAWNRGSVAAHDTMSRHPATGKPGTAATGQTYGALVAGGAPGDWVVADGMLDVKDGFSAGYLELNHGKPVSRIGCEFSFDDRAGAKTTLGMLALISWADGGIAANGIGRRTGMHIIVFHTGVVEITARDAVNGAFVTVARWDVPAFSTSPTVVHRIDAFRNGQTVTIIVNGRALTATDARFAPVVGENFACWEPYPGANHATAVRARIRNVWSDALPMIPGETDGEVRRALGAQQPVVHVIPAIPTPPALTGSYVAISGSELTVNVGPSGRVHVRFKCWLAIATETLVRARFAVQQPDGTTWGQHVVAHVAETVQRGSVSTEAVFVGLTPNKPARIRLEMLGGGGSVVAYGDYTSGRQAIITATPA